MIEKVANTYRIARHEFPHLYDRNDSFLEEVEKSFRVAAGSNVQEVALMPDDAYYITIYTDEDRERSDEQLLMTAINRTKRRRKD